MGWRVQGIKVRFFISNSLKLSNNNIIILYLARSKQQECATVADYALDDFALEDSE